jgi:hypothetical protein
MLIIDTVNHEIFAALKVCQFAFFQLAVEKILHLLLKFNFRVEIFAPFKSTFDSPFVKIKCSRKFPGLQQCIRFDI